MRKKKIIIGLFIFLSIFLVFNQDIYANSEETYVQNHSSIDIGVPADWYRVENNPPKIVKMSFNKKVYGKKDKIVLTLKLNKKAKMHDGESIGIIYTNKVSGNAGYLFAKTKDGINYKAILDLSQESLENGDYVYSRPYQRDFGGNEIVLAKGVKAPVIKLKNMGKNPKVPAKIMSLDLDKTTLTDTNKINIKARLNRPYEAENIYVTFVSENTEDHIMGILAKDKKDKKLYKGNISFDNYYTQPDDGYYKLEKGSEYDKKVKGKRILVKSKKKRKVNPPELVSMRLSKDKLKRGEVLEIKGSLNEKKYITDATLYYQAPRTKVVYEVSPIYGTIGPGRKNIVWKFYLEGYMEPGTYKCIGVRGADADYFPLRVAKNLKIPDFTIVKDDNKPVFPDYLGELLPEKEMLKTYRVKKDCKYILESDYQGDVIDEFKGSLKKGEKITGIEGPSYIGDADAVVFVKNNKFYRVEEKNVEQIGRSATFISKGVNVRDAKGKKLGKLNSGYKIKGKDLGRKIEFTYKGKKAYVMKAYVEEDGTSRNYSSLGVNVRDMKGKKLGYLTRGKKVYGKRNGAYIEIKYKNKKAKVHSKYMK